LSRLKERWGRKGLHISGGINSPGRVVMEVLAEGTRKTSLRLPEMKSLLGGARRSYVEKGRGLSV